MIHSATCQLKTFHQNRIAPHLHVISQLVRPPLADFISYYKTISPDRALLSPDVPNSPVDVTVGFNTNLFHNPTTKKTVKDVSAVYTKDHNSLKHRLKY
jgi:hypothetical protein